MSWFSSFFSSAKPPPAIPAHEQRILEEPTSSTFKPVSSPIPSNPETLDRRPNAVQAEPVNRNRNKIILGAGLGFFAFSMLITRRSFARKRLASKAQFYSDAQGHHIEQSKQVNGAMEAFEALNIATVNVLSLAMVATGGTLWYLDINSMEEARRMIRGGLGVDGTGRSEREAEEDFEEWMAATLSRKEAKEGKGKKTIDDK